MTQEVELKIGTEYYFYAKNYFWSGFLIAITNGIAHVHRGHMYFSNNQVYAYGEAFLDMSCLIGVAST